MKRRTKILLLLVPAFILGVILLLPHGGYRRAVATYKKQLLAQGEKLTIAELAPPPNTNGPNGATALTNAMEGYKLPADYPPMMKLVGPGIAMIGHSNARPVEMISYASNVVKAAELRTILQAPVLYFNLDYSNGFEMLLPHLAKLKNAESLLSITATQALCETNYPEVWSDSEAAVDLPRLFNNEPLMISDLVRFALARIAINATWEALQSDHSWSDSQLAELEAKWQVIDFFAHAQSVIGMERASGIDALVKTRGGSNIFFGTTLADVVVNSFGSHQNPSDGKWGEIKDKLIDWYYRYPGVWLWKSSWSYDEELYYLQTTSAAKEAARRMVTTGTFFPAYSELLIQWTNVLQLHPLADKHFLVFGSGYDNLYSSYLLKLANTETARRLTMTAIALERYHLQHNTYPASLSELVPAFLPQVPLDFMDGKPLRYRLQPDGHFLLYSVGEDGKDDDGDATTVNSSSDWNRARDIVWPRAATPQEVADYLKLHPPGTNSLAQ